MYVQIQLFPKNNAEAVFSAQAVVTDELRTGLVRKNPKTSAKTERRMFLANKKYERKGKRKEIVFSESDWKIVEQKAQSMKLDTTKYITRSVVNGDTRQVNFKDLAELSGELRRIGNNINQLARKAKELNSIYTDDYKRMKEEFEKLCLTLNREISAQRRFAA